MSDDPIHELSRLKRFIEAESAKTLDDLAVADESEARQMCRLTALMQKTINPPHTTPAQFLLAHGKHMTERRITRAKGEPLACYANAYRLAQTRKGYRYVEGFATSVIPLEHAWCIDGEGRVIDPTWDAEYKPDYFGVVFPNLDFVLRIRRMTGAYSVLWAWWKWREIWPLLKQEFEL
jgi:hypothetical protein